MWGRVCREGVCGGVCVGGECVGEGVCVGGGCVGGGMLGMCVCGRTVGMSEGYVCGERRDASLHTVTFLRQLC